MSNVTSPGTLGGGVIGDVAAAEELARVELLTQVLGPAALAVVGFKAANAILDLIVGPDRGDSDVLLVVGIDAQGQRFASALSTNRTVTLSLVGVHHGARFRVVRTGLGPGQLDVGPGVKVIAAGTGALVDVTYEAGAWRLTGWSVL